MKSQDPKLDVGRLRSRLIAVLSGIMIIAVAVLALSALIAFDRAITPELENRTQLIGSILRSEIQRSVQLGIPLESLAGLNSYLSDTIAQFGEIRRVAVISDSGTVIAETQRPELPTFLERTGIGRAVGIQAISLSLPVLVGHELVAEILVESSPRFTETRLRNVFLDVAALAIVALLLGVELIVAFAAGSVWKPYGRLLQILDEQSAGMFIHTIGYGGLSGLGRMALRVNDQALDLARRIATLPATALRQLQPTLMVHTAEGAPPLLRYSDFNDIRLALFLFVLGTEVTASFLPIFAKAAARPDWLSPELAAAAPLGLYLLAVAALTPFGGPLVQRFGPRQIFSAAVVPVVIALAAMALSDNLLSVIICRGGVAVFYALATIACHDYAIHAAGDEAGSQSSSAFIAMIFGGTFCGSIVGGILAGHFGYPVAIFSGAGFVVLAGIVGYAAMGGRAGDRRQASEDKPAQVSFASGTGPSFAALVIGIAIPLSATTAVFIWYLAPLMLSTWGHSPADIARVIMLYYLAAILFGPLASGLSDSRFGAWLPILMGAVAAGLALLSLELWSGFWAITVAVVSLGIGHALIRAPQFTLAIQLSNGASHRLGLLRLAERLGALAGLSIGAVVFPKVGAATTLIALGVVVLFGVFGFSVIAVFTRERGGS